MNLLKLTSTINFIVFAIFMLILSTFSNITNSTIAHWLLVVFLITTFINGVVAMYFSNVAIPRWVK